MDVTPILVASVAATPGLMTGVAAFMHMRRNVGKSNGQGSVVTMLESVLRCQGEHDAKFARISARLDQLDGFVHAAGRSAGIRSDAQDAHLDAQDAHLDAQDEAAASRHEAGR